MNTNYRQPQSFMQLYQYFVSFSGSNAGNGRYRRCQQHYFNSRCQSIPQLRRQCKTYLKPDLSDSIYGEIDYKKINLGFIGAGKIAEGLARAFIQAGVLPGKIHVHDNSQPRIDIFKNLGMNIYSEGSQVVQKSSIVIFCQQPHDQCSSVFQLKQDFNAYHVVVSVATGIQIRHIEEVVPRKVGVVRLQANAPAAVGAMAGIIAYSRAIKQKQKDVVRNLFQSIGYVQEVSEREEWLFDTMAGLCSYGTAYIYMVIESMAEGAVKGGMSREMAIKMAAQTVLGAGKMVMESDKHPAQLRDEVSAPGEYTVEGIISLEKGGLRSLFIEAVSIGADKTSEISEQIDEQLQ